MKNILKLAFPFFLSSVLNIVLSFFDTILVGRLGVNAIGAVASGSSVFSIISQVLSSLIIGFQVFGARTLGNNNEEEMEEYFYNSLVILYVFSGIAILISLLFLNPLMLFFSSPDILADAKLFFIGRIFGLLIFPLSLTIKTSFDIRKLAKIGFYFSVISVSTNIIFDYIFMFVLNLGVFGSGLGSSLSLLMGTLYLLKKNRQYEFTKLSVSSIRNKFNFDVIKKLNKVNYPEAINCLFDYLGSSLLIAMLSTVSVTNIAAGKISVMYLNFYFAIAMNLALAIQILISQSSDKQKNTKYVIKGTLFGMGIATLIILISLFNISIFITPFTNDFELSQITKVSLFYIFLTMLIVPIVTTTTAILRANQKSKWNTYINIGSVWIIQIPSAYFAIQYLHLEAKGLSISYLLYFLARLFLNVASILYNRRNVNV